MPKKIFSLKSIVYSRLFFLSLIFIIFLLIIFLLSNLLINNIDKKYSMQMEKNTVNFLSEKIDKEIANLESSFLKLHLIADQNKGNISAVIDRISFGNHAKVNLYKEVENSYILSYVSAEKPANVLNLPPDVIASTSTGSSKIYKTFDKTNLILNGYFGYTFLDSKYIVQIFKTIPINLENISNINIFNDKNHKFVNFDNEEVTTGKILTNSQSNAFYLPATKQYITFNTNIRHSFSKILVVIIICLCILFVFWLTTEIFYYKFSTKPIIEITNSLKEILVEPKNIDFKEQRIEEYVKISQTAKTVIEEISSQRHKMETLLDRLPIPVAVINNDYDFIYRNSSFNTLFTLPEDIGNQNFLDIIPETLKVIDTNLTNFLTSPKQKEKFEIYDPKRNEYYIVRFGKIADHKNQVSNTIILFNDITYQKKELENQKKRKEEIESILMNIEESVIRLASSSSELKTSAESLSTMLAQQNTSLAEANIAIQELTSSADNIFNKTQHISEVSDKVDNASQVGFREVEKSFNKINSMIKITDELTSTIFNLNKKTHKIDKILKTIYEISEQTNLLALNASVESVRGESNSMSFKVIAEEIRELSDKTYTFSKEIESELEEITDVGSKSVMIVEEAEKLMKDVFNHMNENKGNFEFIKNEADHINKHLKEIINVLKDLNNASNDIFATSNDLTVAMKDALNSAKESQQASFDIDAVIKNLNETLTHLGKLK